MVFKCQNIHGKKCQIKIGQKSQINMVLKMSNYSGSKNAKLVWVKMEGTVNVRNCKKIQVGYYSSCLQFLLPEVSLVHHWDELERGNEGRKPSFATLRRPPQQYPNKWFTKERTRTILLLQSKPIQPSRRPPKKSF